MAYSGCDVIVHDTRLKITGLCHGHFLISEPGRKDLFITSTSIERFSITNRGLNLLPWKCCSMGTIFFGIFQTAPEWNWFLHKPSNSDVITGTPPDSADGVDYNGLEFQDSQNPYMFSNLSISQDVL